MWNLPATTPRTEITETGGEGREEGKKGSGLLEKVGQEEGRRNMEVWWQMNEGRKAGRK